MTTRWGGTKSTAIIEELFQYGTSERPLIGGTAARPPTLMKMRSEVSTSSPTRTARGDSKRAWPV